MFRCDKRCDGCDGKFGNFVGTKHTPHDLYSVAALTILEYPKNKAQHFIH